MLQEGTKVKIRNGLEPYKEHNEFIVVDDEQLDYCGQEVEIDRYYEELDGYLIKEDAGQFLWHENMFEVT